MNGSPITSWDGAEAYFTFATSPGVIMVILIISVVACFGAIIYGGLHENEAYRHNMPDLPE
ncbi:MAG: hypothetical protein AAGF94_12220 [Pseudomonadota bacterium]